MDLSVRSIPYHTNGEIDSLIVSRQHEDSLFESIFTQVGSRNSSFWEVYSK